MSTNELSLIKESGSGKMFNTGDDKIRVLQLQGSWFEMGQQYGTLVKDLVDDIYESTVQALYDKQWTTEEEASELFGSRVLGAASIRRQQLYRGVSDGLGWPVDRTYLLVGLLDRPRIGPSGKGKACGRDAGRFGHGTAPNGYAPSLSQKSAPEKARRGRKDVRRCPIGAPRPRRWRGRDPCGRRASAGTSSCRSRGSAARPRR